MAYKAEDFNHVVVQDCTILNVLAQFCATIYEKELRAEDSKDELIISDKNNTLVNHNQEVPRNKGPSSARKTRNRKVRTQDYEDKSLSKNDEPEYVHKIKRPACKKKNRNKVEQTEGEVDNSMSKNNEELHKTKKRKLTSEPCEKKEVGKHKRRKHVKATNPPGLPEAFLNKIKEATNKTDIEITDVKLVIQKTLFTTDLTDHHARVSMPLSQVYHDGFMTKSEIEFLQEEKGDNKHKNNFRVKVVDPSLSEWYLKLGMWAVSKWTYVLYGSSWKEIVFTNKLTPDKTRLQIWVYKYVDENNENKWCFALVDLDKEEERGRRREEEERRNNNLIGNINPALE